jgi:Lrp/AsnC family transcriptional regulator for asnA, asnC and gidA
MARENTDSKQRSQPVFPYSPFDALDYRILRELHKNARASAAEISRAVEANERTVRKRIDRLVEMGVGRFTLVLEPHVFGYGISVDIFLGIDPDFEQPVVEQLLAMPQISYLAFNLDNTEISIEARFQTNEEFHEFLNYTLPVVEGLEVKDFALVPRILRNIDEWLPPPEMFGIEKSG